MPYRKAGLDRKPIVPYEDYIDIKRPDFEFIGREDELNTLIRTLHLPSTNSVLLTGPKGVGRRSLLHGLVKNQGDDRMPNEFMIRPIYRLNTNMIFGTGTPQRVEERFNDALSEMQKIYERRGVRPVLVIEDGTNFINNVTATRATNVMSALMESDDSANFIDVIISANDQSCRELEKAFPTFLNGFTTISIEEPSKEETLQYLRHHAERYSEQGVTIPDETLEHIFEATEQYKNIFPFAQPKRSVRMLDEVATAYKLEMHSKPEGVHEKEAQLEDAQAKLSALEAGEDVTFSEDKAYLEQVCAVLPGEIQEAYDDFSEKKKAIRGLQDTVRQYEGLIGEKQLEVAKFQEEDAAKAGRIAEDGRERLIKLARDGADEAKGKSENSFRAMSEEEILGFLNYDQKIHRHPKIRETQKEIGQYEEGIKQYSEKIQEQAAVLNYPVEIPTDYVEQMARKLTKTELNPNMFEAMADSEALLNERVLGQEKMIAPIASSLRRAATGRNPKDKPLGSILILGPSGVGKTFIAEQIADVIFGGEKFLSAQNMDSFSAEHTVSALIGAPPGYAGYGDKGALIEKIQSNPYGVLLIDEVEKAHKKIKQSLLTALDKGRLTGMDGEEADLRNNLVIQTSNYGQDLFLDPNLSFEEACEQVHHRIYRDPEHFSPEFLNRTTIVFANFLTPEVIAKIAQAQVKKIEASVQETHPDFYIQMSEQSAAAFVSDNYDQAQGARIVKDILEQTIGDEADRKIIEAMRSKSAISGVMNVQYQPGQGFTFGFSNDDIPAAAAQFAASGGKNAPKKALG